jgi:IS30 family transposase
MGNKYNHLTSEERDEIANLNAKEISLSEIARRLGRSKSTISNEIIRNSSNNGYYSQQAQQKAEKRWKHTHKKIRINNLKLREYIEEKLKQGWSPEQIAGRLKAENSDMRISHEAIYQYIYEDNRALCLYLPRKHTRRLKKCSIRKTKRTIIPDRVSIQERPKVIDIREEFGHFEADSVVSRKSKFALNTMVERKSRFTIISIIQSKTAKNTAIAIKKALQALPDNAVKSFTYDNGTEFALHMQVNKELNTKSYFCEPYHSWEKGSIENRNGIIRRYLPKGTDFAKIKDVEIKWIQDRINNTPMKCLGYRTPKEVFEQECTSVSLAS